MLFYNDFHLIFLAIALTVLLQQRVCFQICVIEIGFLMFRLCYNNTCLLNTSLLNIKADMDKA